MAEQRDIDWEAVEREYRTGQLSIREVGRIYGLSDTAIRKRAKEYRWERDLKAHVEARAKAKLTRAEAAEAPGYNPADESTEQVVEAAAEMRARTVLSHRKGAGQARGLVSSLWRELEELTALAQGEEEHADPIAASKQRSARVSGLVSRSTVAQRLAMAMQTLVTIERQALGLDPKGNSSPAEEEVATPFAMYFGGKAQKDAVEAAAAKGATTH